MTMKREEKIAIFIILTVVVAESLLISDMYVDDKNDHSERITIATFVFQFIQTLVILTLLIPNSSKVKVVVDYLIGPELGLCIVLMLYAFVPSLVYLEKNGLRAKGLKLGIVIMPIWQLVALPQITVQFETQTQT